MKVFQSLVTLYNSAVSAVCALFKDEVEQVDRELSSLEEEMLRAVVPVLAKLKKK